MVKRIHLTLDDGDYEDLERWATWQNRPVANLATFLVLEALRDARIQGKIPKDDKTSSEELVTEFLQTLLEGEHPSPAQIAKLAHQLDVSEEQVVELCKRQSSNGSDSLCHT
ncbi:hypothetical protein IQ235_03925 [Oscillatoriales cyanobacterium LEGE 11467]|uniref:CopG-like ribbon-helix-helix domain-containing protein n=1 Tax=Zarconia navalis LEGE 11467 TaxID=1828826 RepID=A0A928Z6W5_9CYAN|nr:hypothetical protein [Zarconia navalis]MBE9039940.1 hypothetical protein [Zarconia navalis LEGE 11467]